jgi:hypothetical protein
MSKPNFLYNLREETFNAKVTSAVSPVGYLLAPAYATKTTRALAEKVRKGRYRFFADNGNFTLIQKLRVQFSGRAQKLWLEVAKVERRLGRSLRLSDKAKRLRTAYRKLAFDVQVAAGKLSGTGENEIKAQLALNPTALIGLEDITMATWLALNIEPDYLDFPRSRYRSLNRSVAVRAVARRSQLAKPLTDAYYPVASAISYNSALDAGREFAKAGHERIALGFGAFMADDNWTDHVEIGKRLIALKGRWPNRYIRTAVVAKGFWAGYTEVKGRAPQAFHFLGLGAPIMIPLVTLAAWATPDLTFDATSPIKDAVQGGTLYVSKPAFLKIRTQKVAYRLASDPTADWDCPCPFCHSFLVEHPLRREIGFKWIKDSKKKDVEAKDLRPTGALFKAFPVLSEPGGGSLRAAVNQARIGHNHWVLDKITASLRRTRTKSQLDIKVQKIITDYEKYAKTDTFAGAIRFSYDLICGRGVTV